MPRKKIKSRGGTTLIGVLKAVKLLSTGNQMRVPQILFHVHVLEQTDGAH